MKFLSMYKTAERNQPPSQQEMETMGKLMQDWFASGKLLAAEGCMPSQFGARVRQTKGQFAVTDGPFSESKELVGGLAILQAPSREAAIEYAKEFMKVAGDGECELRQLYEMPNPTR
jgi:hypothetical protein